MNITTKTLFTLTLISSTLLTACNSVGNVVPKNGPSMEQVYDNMGKSKNTVSATNATKPNDIKTLRQEVQLSPIYSKTSASNQLTSGNLRGFHQAPNPMLHLYVYPHLSDNELPVPGYETAFNAYDKDHWTVI